MVFRWLTLGVAIGAVIYAVQNPSQIPQSASEASLQLQEFWHRTFFMHQSSPFDVGLQEQSHIKQHPPPKDALSPAQAKKAAEHAAKQAAKLARAREAMPVYFVSHGGPETMFKQDSMAYRAWQSLGKEIMDLKPKGMVVASAYWEGENDGIQVNNGLENPLLYDFQGFPDEYYQQTFHSKPDPALAQRVIDLINEKDKKLRPSGKARGLDHGVWVPFKAMFGDSTDIPIVQVTIPDTGSPKEVLRLGQALQVLRNEKIVIIGAGMTVHNLLQRNKYASSADPPSYTKEYEKQVVSAVTDYTGKGREAKFRQMCFHPHYRNAHPTPQHLWPLHIAVGAAGDDEGEVLFSMLDGSMAWGNYRFGPTEQVM